ncbi:MAG: phosphotransferase [Oligoflexia bacterium]|nr:phosphotransferase [Oligoflexia bacterium]
MKLNLEKSELIQNLWGGYGELLRVQIDGKSYILKKIKLPNKTIDLSFQRKAKSYQVESYWYEFYTQHSPIARTAKLIEKNSNKEESQWLLLEDLKSEGFQPKNNPSHEEVLRCLDWFSQFHRHYLNKSPDGLWDIGTYWHLETRPDELERMTDIELKEAAHLIDLKLNSAKYQTIVHGDGKLANFLFSENAVAAVDFQYVGGGIGVKDVVLFLSSLLSGDQLLEKAEQYINYYFQQLNLPAVEEEWRALLPFAWADFFRFLQGWSPEHTRINNYSTLMKNKALSCL